MGIQEELREIAEDGEAIAGYEEVVAKYDFSADGKIEEACQAVYNKLSVDMLRRTTLIIADLVAFHFKLYLMIGEFIKENTWARNHVEEVATLVNKKAGEDPTLTYDIILQQIKDELSAKYKGEGQ